MAEKAKYTAIQLPESLVEELKVWKMAYAASYGRAVSYGEMISGMLACLDETEPAVVDAMSKLIKINPELAEKLGSRGNHQNN